MNVDLLLNLVVEGERVEINEQNFLIDTVWDAAGNITGKGTPVTGVVDQKTGIIGIPAAGLDASGNLVAVMSLFNLDLLKNVYAM
jgi:hypothetical protein